MTVAKKKPPLYGQLEGPRPWAIVQAEGLALLDQLPPGSVDAVVTDPPYGISFAREEWDSGRLADGQGFEDFTGWCAKAALRVLRPGGYLAAFGAPRTFHRLVCGLEDAGFDIRDQLLWFYGGAGFAKSRRIQELQPGQGDLGTALKPTYEPIALVRKPLVAGYQVADHVRQFGTGAMQIDAAGVPRKSGEGSRWPAHLALTHLPGCATGTEALDDHALLTETSGCLPDCPVPLIDQIAKGAIKPPSRLFYAAKASPKEREAGLEAIEAVRRPVFGKQAGKAPVRSNIHPTVKPIAVMRHLVRLLVPPGGVVLDPFCGSGSTGIAAVLENRPFLGIEQQPDYSRIARHRITHWRAMAARRIEP